MEAIGADFYVCSPYKFLGPHIGMLAASPALLETMHPDKLRPSTEQVPERFELGTLPYELLAGRHRRHRRAGRPRARRRGLDVASRADRPVDDGAGGVRGRPARAHALRARVDRRGPLPRACAACARPTELFSVDGVAAADVYRGLAARGVNAPGRVVLRDRGGGVGRAWARPGAVRAGLAPYTNADDVDRLLAGVAEIARASTPTPMGRQLVAGSAVAGSQAPQDRSPVHIPRTERLLAAGRIRPRPGRWHPRVRAAGHRRPLPKGAGLAGCSRRTVG